VNRTIYKYDFPDDTSVMRLPLCDPKVLLVASQGPTRFPTVWIEHELLGTPSLLTLEVFGTGHMVSDDMTHVGSAVCGPFVWHVYSTMEPL